MVHIVGRMGKKTLRWLMCSPKHCEMIEENSNLMSRLYSV